MSEATFKAHLKDLENIFGLLQTDFETGPKRDIGNWFDEMLNVIYNSEDTIEDIINARNNYDAESIDDFATVEDDDDSAQEEVNYSLDDEDILKDESESEDLDDEEDNIDENEDDDEDIEIDEDNNEYLVESAKSKANKSIIIKIILK